MNDFLDNLAERATYAEQSVRPRLLSLFEPVTPAAQLPRPEQEGPVGAESLELTVEREISAADQVRDPSPRSSSEAKSRNQSTRRAEIVPSIESPSPERPDPQPVAEPRRLRVELKEPMSLNSREQASLEPAIETPRSQEVSAEREHPAVEDEMVRQIVRSIPRPSLERSPESTRRTFVESPPQLPVRSALQPPAQPLIQTSNTIDRDRAETSEDSGPPRAFEPWPPRARRSFPPPRLEANRSEPIEHARDETTTVQSKSNHTEITQVVRPNLDGQIEPLMTRPLRRMQGDSSPAPEQVINVTIGRIEVRATAPPPAQARSANQKPPVMSLDEYLQRRAGGGRGGGV